MVALGRGKRWAWGVGLQRVPCLCFQSCSVESVASPTSTNSGGWRPFSAGRSRRKDALGSQVSCTSSLAGSRGGGGGAGLLCQLGKGCTGVGVQRKMCNIHVHAHTCTRAHTHTHVEIGSEFWKPKLCRMRGGLVGRYWTPAPVLTNSFLHQVFPEHLLYARHSSRLWRN